MLWNKNIEEKFFREKLKTNPPEKLFYKTQSGRYLAYWPKGYKGKRATLQSRNALIGEFTEKWVENLLQPLAENLGIFVKRQVICEELSLDKRSPADIALVRVNRNRVKPEEILLIIEVKMSIVWNWEYIPKNNELKCIGDYTTHEGNPSLLRSDTMLKAIGKSLNIRISDVRASKIPIVVIGNTPISKNYYKKVDILRKIGIIQRFFSVNPKFGIKNTPGKGFIKIEDEEELYTGLENLINSEKVFFGAMLSEEELGKIIEKANHGKSFHEKAKIFLKLLRNGEG